VRLQRKSWEARQCVVGLGSFQGIPEKVVYGAVRVKPKLQWRLEEVRDARNMECLPKKAAGNEGKQSKREAMWAATGMAVRGRAAQTHWQSFHDTICHGYWTWSYRI
jgi:hypothetical protein